MAQVNYSEYYRTRYQSQQNPEVQNPPKGPEDSSYENNLEVPDSEDPSEPQNVRGPKGSEDPLEEDPLGDGDKDSTTKNDVTRDEILALLKEVQDGSKKTDGEMTNEEAIKILKEVLKTEDTQDDVAAYNQVLEAVGGEEDPEDKDIKKWGAKPSKVEGGTTFFNGAQDGGNLSLKAPGEGAQIEVDKVSSVSLTPHDPKDKVKISKSGKDLIVKMGNDTFKIKNGAEDVHVQINSDNVEGKVPTDLDISVGASSKTSKKYFDPKKLKESIELLREGANQISAIQYGTAIEDSDIPGDSIGRSLDMMFGMSKVYALKPTTKYAVGWYGDKLATLMPYQPQEQAAESAAEVESTKKVITALADYMEAKQKGKDPKKIEKLGEELSVMVSELKTQTEKPGNANNKGQLIYTIIVGQLGKDGAKELFKQGIIPEGFAKGVADLLETAPEEKNDTTTELNSWIYGNNGDTHATAAAWLKDNATAADGGNEPTEDPTKE